MYNCRGDITSHVHTHIYIYLQIYIYMYIYIYTNFPYQKHSRDNCMYPVHVRVLPWYENSVRPGDFLGIITYKYPVYKAYIGIYHMGTLVGVHPSIP